MNTESGIPIWLLSIGDYVLYLYRLLIDIVNCFTEINLTIRDGFFGIGSIMNTLRQMNRLYVVVAYHVTIVANVHGWFMTFSHKVIGCVSRTAGRSY